MLIELNINEEDKNLSHYLANKIADYIEQEPIDRSSLIKALLHVCKIAFCEETPLNTFEQCQEIQDFADILKCYATNSFL